jgi:hypothetical protein
LLENKIQWNEVQSTKHSIERFQGNVTRHVLIAPEISKMPFFVFGVLAVNFLKNGAMERGAAFKNPFSSILLSP